MRNSILRVPPLGRVNTSELVNLRGGKNPGAGRGWGQNVAEVSRLSPEPRRQALAAFLGGPVGASCGPAARRGKPEHRSNRAANGGTGHAAGRAATGPASAHPRNGPPAPQAAAPRTGRGATRAGAGTRHSTDSGPQGPRTPLNTGAVAGSASRLGLPVLQTPASVEVVSQETMKEQGYRTTTETAQGAVGVLSGDAAGAPAAFQMRGFTFGQVNILYNGISTGPQSITSRWMDTAASSAGRIPERARQH